MVVVRTAETLLTKLLALVGTPPALMVSAICAVVIASLSASRSRMAHRTLVFAYF